MQRKQEDRRRTGSGRPARVLRRTARGDLIRSSASRSFPDIAGDIVGTQTYTYDPLTQTGIFQVINAPHLISLGPSLKDMFQMLPDHDGTLTQSLQMKLDSERTSWSRARTTRSRSAAPW